MKNIIVTGAGGFVGKNLIESLINDGYEVYAVIRPSSNKLIEIESRLLHKVECDMKSYNQLIKMIPEADTCFHLAWEGTSGELRGNQRIQINNIHYSCDLIEACKKIGVRNFIFAGSIMEYEYLQIKDDLANNNNRNYFYSLSKYCAHLFCEQLCTNLDIRFSSLLISNIYGPGEQSTRFLNTFLNKLLNNESMPLSAGNQMYDFIYIDDAVNKIKLIGEHGKNHEEYYIGSETQKPLKEFLIEAKNLVNPGYQMQFGALNGNPISLTYNEFDTNKIVKQFQIANEISFNEGIKYTIGKKE